MSFLLAFTMILGLLSTGLGILTANAASTASDGYVLIDTAAEFDYLLRNNLSGRYRLTADIDLSEYTYGGMTTKNGWEAIGCTKAKAFRGILDGDGHTITGLWSWRTGANSGLFGYLYGATVKNLTINMPVDDGILGGAGYKGAIAGNALKGSLIQDCNVIGADTGAAIYGTGNYIGGIVGILSESNVVDCCVTQIGLFGCDYLGGIAGVAEDSSVISGCLVENVQATASANCAGGVAGKVITNSTVTNCEVNTVSISGSEYLGGLVGVLYTNAQALGNSVTSAQVTGKNYCGGFVGKMHNKSNAEENIVWSASVRASNCYAGGFVGTMYNNCNAYRCFSIADVTANNYAGGWAGEIKNSTVQVSCSYGAATALNSVAGGFAAYVACTDIKNAYSQADVTTGKISGTGGFVGYFDGCNNNTVYNTYSSGTVTCGGGDSTKYVGSYSGFSGVTYNGTNYYDATKTSYLRPYGSGGTQKGTTYSYPQGRDTEAMMQQATFQDWDFNSIWGIDENETYPYFIYLNNYRTSVPTINSVYEGDTAITGTGIAGAYILVTFQNGATSYAVVGANGQWTANVPPTVTLVEGDIVAAIQQEGDKPASNTVYTVVIGVEDNTSQKPTIDDVYMDSSEITGTGVPGATITITYPDGSVDYAQVGSDNTWSVDKPWEVKLDEGDVVTANQTEPGKDVSEDVPAIVKPYYNPYILFETEQENLDNGSEGALVGDRILYTIDIHNYGLTTQERTALSVTVPDGMDLNTSVIAINGSPISPGTGEGYYQYNTATKTLTVYIGDISYNQSVVVSFMTTITEATGNVPTIYPTLYVY